MNTLYENALTKLFFECTALTTVPELPAETLTGYCYNFMFRGCSALKFAESSSVDYPYEYRLPSTGTGTTAECWNINMFAATGGTFTGDPSINTTYYTNATVI